jgi:hypothetical protein
VIAGRLDQMFTFLEAEVNLCYRDIPPVGWETLGSARKLTAGAPVDRNLRFFDS